MDFQELPADWPTIPLTDPHHIANVLDVFVATRDRMVGSLLVLICDEQRRPVQPIIINGIGDRPPGGEDQRLALVARNVAELRPDATVLCAIARRGRTHVTRADLRWARTLEAAFARHLDLIGVQLITLDGTVPIPRSVQAAA